MATKQELQAWVVEAIENAGGTANQLIVAKHIWANHEADLRAAGDLFYTWQYDFRWEAKKLRDAGVLRSVDASPKGLWQLRD